MTEDHKIGITKQDPCKRCGEDLSTLVIELELTDETTNKPELALITVQEVTSPIYCTGLHGKFIRVDPMHAPFFVQHSHFCLRDYQ